MGIHSGIISTIILTLMLPVAVSSQLDISITPIEYKAMPGGTAIFTITFSASGIQEGVIITENLQQGLSLKNSEPKPGKIHGSELKWLFENRSGISGGEVTYSVNIPPVSGNYNITGNWTSIDSDGEKKHGEISPVSIKVVSRIGKGSSGGLGVSGASGVINGPEQDGQAAELPTKYPCILGERLCEGNAMFTCTRSGWALEEECPSGCSASGCIDSRPETAEKPIKITGRLSQNSSVVAGAALTAAMAMLGAVYIIRRRKTKSPEKFMYDFSPVND